MSKNIKISAKMTSVLINMPIPIEKPTSPSLYSFFHGRKYVFSKSGREKSRRNALLREVKKVKRATGASIYQNFRNTNGKDR